MDFDKLNAVAERYVPVKKLIDLEQGVDFQITQQRKVKTQYGVAIVLTIDNKFQVFLPKKYHVFFYENEDEYEKFKTEIIQNTMYINHLGFSKIKFFSKN